LRILQTLLVMLLHAREHTQQRGCHILGCRVNHVAETRAASNESSPDASSGRGQLDCLL
jgi:hypothetical protein